MPGLQVRGRCFPEPLVDWSSQQKTYLVTDAPGLTGVSVVSPGAHEDTHVCLDTSIGETMTDHGRLQKFRP